MLLYYLRIKNSFFWKTYKNGFLWNKTNNVGQKEILSNTRGKYTFYLYNANTLIFIKLLKYYFKYSYILELLLSHIVLLIFDTSYSFSQNLNKSAELVLLLFKL